jgi:NhaP-type Na+/H+ or K+/H+ antiporter
MAAWLIVIGTVLIVMALLDSIVDRLPLSSALIYLAIGLLLGPGASGWLTLHPASHAPTLELLFLIAVLVSLFTVGLKLRTPNELFTKRLWTLPLRLAGPAMLITIALLSVFAATVLSMPWGLALLLGAILAPTDPVLASDIRVRHEDDRDSVRFALSAEGGLNDATAAPFVLLGLGVLGLHELGTAGWQWFAVDLVWGTLAGFGIGWLCGLGVGAIVLMIRRRYAHAYGLEEFLGLGLIALSYGLADALHAIGFLAVLAAGLAMRRFESHALKRQPVQEVEKPRAESEGKASLPREAATHMVGDVLDFNQRFESIGEVTAVVVAGALLSAGYFSLEGLAVALVLFVFVRPLSVYVATIGSSASSRHKRLMGWFGIRGVGTLYYLMFAIDHDLQQNLIDSLTPIVLTVVAASIVVHGISATPMMAYYERSKRRRRDTA